MSEHDNEPWYRQFWPWFLILLPACAVVASLYSVLLAMRTTDSLVTSSDDGMDVVTARMLAAERFAAETGLEATLNIDTTSGSISVTVTAVEHFDKPKTLDLIFSHPTLAHRDQAVTLTMALPDADGHSTWSGHVVDLLTGRWYVVLKSGDTWRLSNTWSGERTLKLAPPKKAEPE